MGKAAYQTEQALRQMERDAKIVGAAMGAMAVSAAGALAIMVKQSIDAADTLRDLSQQTGIAIETLNGLGFAASQSGGSLEGIVAAAGKLNKSIAEAAKGNNEQADAFKVLGINVQDASGKLKTADVVMAEMADKFAKFADGPEKVALATATMGKAGAEQISVLNDGGDALRANIDYAKQYSAVTIDLANASDEFNDTMGKLHVQQKGFANTLTAAVLPVLQAIADETLHASEQSNGFKTASGAVRTVLETMVVVGSEVAFVFKGVGTEIGGIAAQIAALGRGDFKGFSAIGDAMKADAERARAEHDAFIARIMDRTPASVTADGVPADSKPPAPRLPNRAAADAQKKLIEEGKALAIGLQAQDNGLSGDFYKKWDSLALAYKAGAINLDLLTIAQAELLKQQPLMKAAAAERVKADIDGFKAMDDLRKAAEAEEQRSIRNVDQISVSLMNEVERENLAYTARMEALQKYHDAKLENVQRADALIEQENARHKQALTEMQAANDMQSLSMMAGTADQIYQLMQQSGQQQSGLARAAFLASKALAVAEILMNTEVAAAKAGAQLGIFGIPMATMIRATGYASAGLVAGMAVAGMREKGGPVWPGAAFVVGEKGPELFVPSTNGTIIPNGSGLSKPQQNPINITINNALGNFASQSDVVAGMQIVKQQIYSELARQSRYGGATA